MWHALSIMNETQLSPNAPESTEPAAHTVPLPPGFPRDAVLPAVVLELGRLFAEAGHELSLVGGPVRDLFLGRDVYDLDFTTDAGPEETKKVGEQWADAVWDIGATFGTIGFKKSGWQLEVTTYRAEKYDPDSRKPVVAFGDSLEDDLYRRDFTVNAMALRLPSLNLVDPFGGIKDLVGGVLKTPGTATDSFSDDPLRMMRAARFASQLGFVVAEEVTTAMTDMAQRIEIISAERVREELVKLICGDKPRAGINLLVDTGLARRVLPEVPDLKLEADEHHRHKDVYEHSLTVMEQSIDHEPDYVESPDFTLRFAALMHDVGKPSTRHFGTRGAVTFRNHDVVGAKMVRQRMRALKFDKETTRAVSRLVELHMRFYGYGDAGWTDSAVRRYVTDAGEQLNRLHALTRSDVTTRNRRKAERLAHAYDDLEQRIEKLAEQEELDAIRPDLNGEQIMNVLGIKPGPEVGKAYQYLLQWRLDDGPHEEQEAKTELHRWWAEQGQNVSGTESSAVR